MKTMKNKNSLSGCQEKSRLLKTATVGTANDAPFGQLGNPMGKVWIAYEEDKEGNPVILITSPATNLVSVRVLHADVPQENQEASCPISEPAPQPFNPPSNLFLKDGYRDSQILEAMKTAHARLLEQGDRGEVKFDSDKRYKTKKRFVDIHLLVCLFFYIYTERRYRSGDFIYGLRGKYFSYCVENLKETGIVFCSKRYFYRMVSELMSIHGSFDDYIRAEKKPPIPFLKGEQYIPFWYEVYLQARPCFQSAISLEKKKE